MVFFSCLFNLATNMKKSSKFLFTILSLFKCPLRLWAYNWFIYFFGYSLAPVLRYYIPLDHFIPVEHLNAIPPFNPLLFIMGFLAYLFFYVFGRSTNVNFSPRDFSFRRVKLNYGAYDVWASVGGQDYSPLRGQHYSPLFSVGSVC